MAVFTGLASVLKNLKDESKAIKSAAAGSLYAEGQQIMAESIKQVPVDTGRTRQSANVSRPSLTGDPKVRLSYGTEYSLALHERIEVPHVVGKAKFLEDPVDAAKRGYERRVGKRAERMYKRGEGLLSVPVFVVEE